MRYLSVLVASLPSLLWAEDIPLQSTVSAVTLYPQGATITREVAFSSSAGTHQLIFTDLPENTPLAHVRVAIEGAEMGNVTLRNDYLPPIDIERAASLAEIEQRIEELEDALIQHDQRIDLLSTEIKAAQAQAIFLEQLGQGEGVAALGVDALRDLSGMIGEETLTALQSAHQAELRVDDEIEAKEDTEEALERALQELSSLQPAIGEDRAMLAVTIRANEAAEGRAVITYTIQEAGWQPAYDFRLTRATGTLSVERGAFIAQSSGENWRDVELTLSTARPSAQTAPSEVWPWLRRIYDPADIKPMPTTRMEISNDMLEGAVISESMVEPAIDQADAIFDGISVMYTYSGTMDVANKADRVRVALGTQRMQVDLEAVAVPLSDTTAYLMASLHNTSDELILPTWEAMFYLDGRFVGRRGIEMIPAGAESQQSFGPIEGLRLTRVIVERREGDRGVISKSSEVNEHARLSVENLTGETWPIRLIDRVPYSEQDELVITWESDVAPTEQNVDDKRGVMAWAFELAPGQSKDVNLTHEISWPDDKSLH